MKKLLWYSGGKDSLAVLLLLRSQWDSEDFHVAWVDTGNQFPEVYEHMDIVKAYVKNFHVLKSDTAEWQREHGQPVDLLPTSKDKTGQYIYGETDYRPYVSRWECCKANIWDPMTEFMTKHHPEVVYRGDRSEERAPGQREAEGITVVTPIFGWSRKDVMDYLLRNARKYGLFQSRHTLHEGSSLDCTTCTAYHCEHKERLKYLKEHHPGLYEANRVFFEHYKEDIFQEMKEIL